MLKLVRTWLAIGLIAVVVLFILQNFATVQVTFLFWNLELPRAVLLFGVLLLGLVAGWALKNMQGHHGTRD